MLKMSQRLIRTLSLAALTAGVSFIGACQTSAQDSVLNEIYGHGVHAYFAGNHSDATQFLSAAIDGGLKDPRAYYFRGIVAYSQGRPYEAESDWQMGAEMEASMSGASSVGRSLSRFQGSGRLKLEQIRQKARLAALTSKAARSNARMSEIGAASGSAPAATPPAAIPPAASGAVTPPPAAPPAAVADDPFANDSATMAAGEPKIESDDALEGTLGNPFADDPAGMTGGADPGAGASDPFATGGGAAPPADDPFGTPGGAPADDPFAPTGGGGGAAADDPFAGDPFGTGN